MTALLDPVDTGPIADVEVGMPVVDAAGVLIGRVEDVSMSDPGATSTRGNRFRPIGGLLRVLTRAFEREDVLEPHVQEPLRTRLVRIGYLKVARHSIRHNERYVRADRVARVRGGRVELCVPTALVDSEA